MCGVASTIPPISGYASLVPISEMLQFAKCSMFQVCIPHFADIPLCPRFCVVFSIHVDLLDEVDSVVILNPA